MRIFFASPATAHQGALPNSKLWHINLYLPLLDLGHEVETFNYDYSGILEHLSPAIPEHVSFINRSRPRFSEELIRQVKKAHYKKPIKLFFSYFFSSFVFPEVIREISKLGITTVNWYCNGSYQFYLISEIAPYYDYCLVPEKFRLEDYKKIGAHPIYCQEAANPNFYKPYPFKKIYDITFVGQRNGTRLMYVKSLYNAGLDVRAWGAHWRDKKPSHGLLFWRKKESYELPESIVGGVLTDDQLIKMYSRSKISLGFSEVAKSPKGEPPIKQVRLRDFEAAMSGAFYLVEEFDELADFFTPGKEVVFFKDAHELVDKAKYYLAHDSEREKIRKAGLRRARREHTWHQRFRTAFREMGL